MQQPMSAPIFTWFSNRGSGQFAAALEPLGGRRLAAGSGEAPDLLYFDTCAATQAPPPLHPHSLSLIPRERTAALDNKASMARALMASGHTEPRVYFQVEDVPAATDALWFVKSPHRSGGKGIAVVTTAQLLRFQGQDVIIQEAVQDLDLVAGHKYTLRLYVLAFQGKLFLYPEGFAIVHGAPYQPGSRDPAVQFVHEGYLRADSPVRLVPLSELDGSTARLDAAAASLAEAFVVFTDRLKYERDNEYCLFGVDVLIRDQGSAVLVEINDRPNFVHTALINRQVNVPMLRAMAGQLNPDWQRDGESPAPRFQLLLTL